MSEKRLLEENKAEIDDKILAKSIEIEKHELVLSTLLNNYEDKKASAQAIMTDLGEDDIEAIKLKNHLTKVTKTQRMQLTGLT